jgi:hypothetical protein
MLRVRIPAHREPERRYAASVVLRDLLGLEHAVEVDASAPPDAITIAAEGRTLEVRDRFLSTADSAWLTPASLPRRPLARWDVAASGLAVKLVRAELPVLFGEAPFLVEKDDRLALGLEVFGAALFSLARYEEVVSRDRDRHGRFPASASLAKAEGFLDRPILDEYALVLRACLERLWPGLPKSARSFRVVPTHAVDVPFETLRRPASALARRVGGDLVKRRSLSRARASVAHWRAVRSGAERDPFDTYAWIMERSERAGLRSTFYFLVGGATPWDPTPPLGQGPLEERVRAIAARGHEVGLHPSYATAGDGALWKRERETLEGVLGKRARAGRQHFLRGETPATWRLWEENGLEHDSTLGFADEPGFRCGTCREFPLFDLERRRELSVRERPLVAMDVSVTAERYLGLGGDAAFAVFKRLKDACRAVSGDFTFLWHNTEVATPEGAALYDAVLGA